MIIVASFNLTASEVHFSGLSDQRRNCVCAINEIALNNVLRISGASAVDLVYARCWETFAFGASNSKRGSGPRYRGRCDHLTNLLHRVPTSRATVDGKRAPETPAKISSHIDHSRLDRSLIRCASIAGADKPHFNYTLIVSRTTDGSRADKSIARYRPVHRSGSMNIRRSRSMLCGREFAIAAFPPPPDLRA